MKSALYASMAALTLWGVAAPASAETYDFSFDTIVAVVGDPITATGQFTTVDDGLVNFVDFQEIVSATGTINGSAINGVDPNALNFLINGTPLTDIGFTTASGVSYDFSDDFVGSSAGDSSTGALTVTAVSAVPLPAGLPMFGAALFGLGAVGFGLSRNRKAALPA